MPSDTEMGGPNGEFPLTQYSALLDLVHPEPPRRKQALDTLMLAYWKPVYKYIRIRNSVPNEDAKDLTQAFFTRVLEKGFFEDYDPKKSRFRTFIRVCLDRFLSNEQKAAKSLKRGGTALHFSLNYDAVEEEIRDLPLAHQMDNESFFYREWIRSLFGLVIEALRTECSTAGREIPFQLFERYDIEGPQLVEKPSYGQLAREYNLTLSQVTNHLAFIRRRFRELTLERLRSLTGSDEEFETEVSRLLGPIGEQKNPPSK